MKDAIPVNKYYWSYPRFFKDNHYSLDLNCKANNVNNHLLHLFLIQVFQNPNPLPIINSISFIWLKTSSIKQCYFQILPERNLALKYHYRTFCPSWTPSTLVLCSLFSYCVSFVCFSLVCLVPALFNHAMILPSSVPKGNSS